MLGIRAGGIYENNNINNVEPLQMLCVVVIDTEK